jgi:deoxyadenosine/deoxycytidine kinase
MANASSPNQPTPNDCYIAVSGTIGAGKSSLVDFLCRRYDLEPYFEPNEANPYLEDFYADMGRYSFHSQLYFLGAKLKLHRELETVQAPVIQDRTIWEDAEIFAENLFRTRTMSARDYRTYRLIYESIQDTLRPPDLMIYLKCNQRTIRRRIRQRGREMEMNIPASYLKRLQKLYESWIAGYTLSPLVTLETDRLDYISDLIDCHEVMTTIDQYLTGRRLQLWRPGALAP